jgi:plasmid maintenance system antidote protein VapI
MNRKKFSSPLVQWNLLQHIQNRGLKIHFVASQAGISAKALSEIIHGHRHISAQVSEQLSKVLGVKQDQLFTFPSDAHET